MACRRDIQHLSLLKNVNLRINITGNAGAGKTTLSRKLGEALDVPVFSLDSIVWKPGWEKTPPEERRVAEGRLIERPSWIIDGVSRTVRQASDIVVFLDVPRHVCAWRGLKRSLRYRARTRPELPEGCPEWQIVPRLFRIIYRFPFNGGLAISREAEQDKDRYRVVRYPEDPQAVCAELLDIRL